LQITCNIDLSSMKREEGVESFEYHFLLTLRKQEVDIDDFLNILDITTHLKWKYKELCQDKFFILIARVSKERALELHGAKNQITFTIETDFVPLQDRAVIEVKEEVCDE